MNEPEQPQPPPDTGAAGVADWLAGMPRDDQGDVVIGEFEPSPDRHAARQPPTAADLKATFKWEDDNNNGDQIGALIVWDPRSQTVVWESNDWMTLDEANKIASQRGWHLHLDG